MLKLPEFAIDPRDSCINDQELGTSKVRNNQDLYTT